MFTKQQLVDQLAEEGYCTTVQLGETCFKDLRRVFGEVKGREPLESTGNCFLQPGRVNALLVWAESREGINCQLKN